MFPQKQSSLECYLSLAFPSPTPMHFVIEYCMPWSLSPLHVMPYMKHLSHGHVPTLVAALSISMVVVYLLTTGCWGSGSESSRYTW